MSHLPFTLLAYFLNSVSVLTSKFLLVKSISHPLIYIFYISVTSLLVLLLLPFSQIPTLEVLTISSLSTLLWTSGAYVMFYVLKTGKASRVIPVIGALIPLLLLVHAIVTNSITQNQLFAIILLILGLIFLVFDNLKGRFNFKELLLEFLSALLFSLSYLILKEAYNQADFMTVFVWGRFILIPVGVVFLAIPSLRKIILAKGEDGFKFWSWAGVLFALGQITGGISEVLLVFSISLTSPALVNSLQGSQYIFLFIFSLILGRRWPQIYSETLTFLTVLSKVLGIILISLGLIVLAQGEMVSHPKLGITFSGKYAESLGLDPKETYRRMLSELQVKAVRLPVYWDQVEVVEGKFDFSKTDWYLAEAQKNRAEVILVLGYKQPRWPECFEPNWVKSLSYEERDQAILKLVEEEVNYFKKYPNLKYWQLENEPTFDFGDCEKVSEKTLNRLKREIALVRTLDSRPIMLTDSGELSLWHQLLPLADIFGTSLYRSVWNPWFGQLNYPWPPIFYSGKDLLVRKLTGSKGETIISELQTEPWVPAKKQITKWEVSEQLQSFPSEKIAQEVDYARRTGFSEAYLWGVEWWYWMEKQGQTGYLEKAKKIFN